MANIFATIGSVSLFTYSKVYNFSDVPLLLVEVFPLVGAYFIELVMIKTMFGLMWELSRAWPGIQMMVLICFSDRKQWTPRVLRNAYISCPVFLSGWAHPSCLAVAIISMIYQVVAPFVSLFCLAFFLVAEVVYKNNLLYVYTSKSETGGLFWPEVFRKMIVGLCFAHILLASYYLGLGTYLQMSICFVLVVRIIIYLMCYKA
jgi:hypothetical protein